MYCFGSEEELSKAASYIRFEVIASCCLNLTDLYTSPSALAALPERSLRAPASCLGPNLSALP